MHENILNEVMAQLDRFMNALDRMTNNPKISKDYLDGYGRACMELCNALKRGIEKEIAIDLSRIEDAMSVLSKG